MAIEEEFCDCCGLSLNEHKDKLECSCDECEGCPGQLIVDLKFEEK